MMSRENEFQEIQLDQGALILSALPATELECLKDTYKSRHEARLLTVLTLEDGHLGIITDNTIFYPKGGGQPSDRGTITVGNTTFTVDRAELLPSGTVVHHCAPLGAPAKAATETAIMEIDVVSRLTHAKLHTAGHLIDLVMQLSEYACKPIKANHAPGECWIQFSADKLPPSVAAEEMQSHLAQSLSVLQRQPLATVQFNLSADDAQRLGIAAPEGKAPRMVAFVGHETLSRGCGGTHVASTSELGNVTIDRIRIKKGVVSITYSLT
jgi:alanyl-tRNA synthetase